MGSLKRGLLLAAVLFAANAYAAPVYNAVLTDDVSCANANSGTWVEAPDGIVTIVLSGSWDSGISNVYYQGADGVGIKIPGTTATDGSATPYPISVGSGARYCLGLAGSNHSANLKWEIQPMYRRDPQSHALNYRY
jgi:hypothetical protein